MLKIEPSEMKMTSFFLQQFFHFRDGWNVPYVPAPLEAPRSCTKELMEAVGVRPPFE